jgi:WbqC-like protein family
MESNVPLGKLNIGLPGFIFPSVQYCLLIHQGNCILDLGAHYIKQSERNHFWILGANGSQKITLPMESKKGVPSATGAIRLSPGSWYKNQITAIQSAYGKSAFYFYFKEELNELMRQWPEATLGSAIENSYLFLQKHLHLPEAKVLHTFSHEHFELDWRMKKQLPVSITSVKPYHQVFQDRFDFQYNLSALDLLFNLGPEAKHYLQQHPRLTLDLEVPQNSSE